MKNDPTPLHMFDGPELMRLVRTGVIAEADSLRRELSKAVTALNPAATVALAVSRSPQHSAAVALERLKREVAEWLALLSASSDALQAAQRAEQNRLAPVVAAAAHRGRRRTLQPQRAAGRARRASGRAEHAGNLPEDPRPAAPSCRFR